jgi:hypothetical protein
MGWDHALDMAWHSCEPNLRRVGGKEKNLFKHHDIKKLKLKH